MSSRSQRNLMCYKHINGFDAELVGGVWVNRATRERVWVPDPSKQSVNAAQHGKLAAAAITRSLKEGK